MNIRTGNDIKVTFTIKGPASTDTINMKSLRVYFVNNSSDSCPFVKRFPKEPFPQFYEPSAYTVHGCGRFGYNETPSYNKCEYNDATIGYHEYHLWPSYNGFGVKPEKFQDCMEPAKLNEFMAPFTIDQEKNKVSAYFPACEQRDGKYSMVVVMTAYDSGWGKNNLHTYTIDYGYMFDLVKDGSALSGNIVIDGDTKLVDGSNIVEIALVSDSIYLRKGDTIRLGDRDRRGNTYDIQLTLDSGSILMYKPGLLSNQTLQFVANNDAVTVDENGTITVNDLPDTSVDIEITVSNNEKIKKTLTMVPISEKACYVGFATTTDPSSIDVDDPEMFKLFNSPNKLYTVNNPVNGAYLWVLSNTEVNNIQCDVSKIPLTKAQPTNKFKYCYYCPNALINTSFDIIVNTKL